MEIGLTVELMKLDEKLKRGWDELVFWVKREVSMTMLFWQALAVFLLLKVLMGK
jgi:hypothetical protein